MDGDQLRLFPIDEATSQSYREGVDLEPVHRPEVLNRIYEMVLDLGADESMSALVGRWYERLTNDPEARLRAELADRAGISYEMALERWGTPDAIAAALAKAILKSEEHAATCQQCGTKPDDWVFWLDRSEDGLPPLLREKDNPPWQFFLHDCYGCDGLYHRNNALGADDKARGVRWVIKPRAEGEPTVDGFAL